MCSGVQWGRNCAGEIFRWRVNLVLQFWRVWNIILRFWRGWNIFWRFDEILFYGSQISFLLFWKEWFFLRFWRGWNIFCQFEECKFFSDFEESNFFCDFEESEIFFAILQRVKYLFGKFEKKIIFFAILKRVRYFLAIVKKVKYFFPILKRVKYFSQGKTWSLFSTRIIQHGRSPLSERFINCSLCFQWCVTNKFTDGQCLYSSHYSRTL